MKNTFDRKDACFICVSPYQVIGAISIVSGRKLRADLYLSGTFPGYDTIAERLRKYPLFENVYAIDLASLGLLGKMRAVRETVFAGETVRRIVPADVSYGACYLTSRASLKSAILKVLLDRNPEMTRVFFEDGLGTYSERANLLFVTKKRKRLEKFLGWHNDDPDRTVIMANLPELVQYPAPYDDRPVEQMPRLTLDEENRKMLEDVFSVPADGAISEKYIIFDTKRHAPNFLTPEEMELLDDCYDVTMRCAGRENTILKPHPRSTEESRCDIRVYKNGGLPMEVLYASMAGLEKRVLVAYVSSAVFTPRILFDAESYVVCLHRIVRNKIVSGNFESIYEKFRNTYRHPERVSAPESLEELEEILRKFREAENE